MKSQQSTVPAQAFQAQRPQGSRAPVASIARREATSPEVERAIAVIIAKWAPDTLVAEERDHIFDPTNPARAQCYSSALVLHDLFGGKTFQQNVHHNIVVNYKASHVFNVLPGGRELDITLMQFRPGLWSFHAPKPISRKELLEDGEVAAAYMSLRRMVAPLVEQPAK